MARQFRRLIEELRRAGLDARGAGSPEWGADQPGFRRHIRDSASAALHAPVVDASPPFLADWSLSISHAPGYGGWLAVPRPARVGFDVELSARVQEKVVARVCERQEIAAAPDPAYLWSAKESYFKALEAEQPAVIADLKVTRWEWLAPETFAFFADPDPRARGVLLTGEGMLFAACLIVSN